MPLLFAIEGIDGVGKSTLTSALSQELCRLGFSVLETKEPGSPLSPLKTAIRNLVLYNQDLTAFERELLFCVDAAAHERALKHQSASIVLSDRGLWTHLAYLRASLKERLMDWDQYEATLNLFKMVCFKPDGIIYLAGDMELMQERAALSAKKKDAIESRSEAYFRHVLETYEDLIETNQGDKLVVLNARDTTSKNVEAVVAWIQGEYRHDELLEGKIKDFAGQMGA